VNHNRILDTLAADGSNTDLWLVCTDGKKQLELDAAAAADTHDTWSLDTSAGCVLESASDVNSGSSTDIRFVVAPLTEEEEEGTRPLPAARK
jgi:hypothetical protein